MSCILRPVLDSFVVRLIGRERLQRRIVGHVHVVDTGERVVVRSGEELLDVLLRLQADSGDAAPTGLGEETDETSVPASHTLSGAKVGIDATLEYFDQLIARTGGTFTATPRCVAADDGRFFA